MLCVSTQELAWFEQEAEIQGAAYPRCVRVFWNYGGDGALAMSQDGLSARSLALCV